MTSGHDEIERTVSPAVRAEEAVRPAIAGPSAWRRLERIGLYVLMTFLTLFTLIPFVWMFSSAFRPVPEIFQYIYPLSWKTFFPVNFTAANFQNLLFSEGTEWPRYIFNTLFVAGVTVVLGGLVNAMAAYAFARIRFPGRELLFVLTLLTVVIPFEAIALPLYLVVKQIGWLDSYQALIVPGLANAFNIFLLRQFFMGIPRELEEAAIIDGASRFRIFFQVIIPLSWPVLISVGLITFQTSWDAFIWPLIVTSSPSVRVLQIAISNLAGQDAVYWNELFAGVALAAAVPIILFLIFQRYYTQGISTTGLKG